MLPGDPSVKDGEKRLKRMVEKRLLQPESHQTSLKKPSMDGCITVLWTEWMGISGWGMEHLTLLKTCVCFGQCRVRTHRSEFRFDKNPHVSPGDPVVEDGDENEEVEENSDDREETCRDGDKERVPPAKEEDGRSVIKK